MRNIPGPPHSFVQPKAACRLGTRLHSYSHPSMGNPDVCSVWDSITVTVLCPCVSCRWRLTVACSTSASAWTRSSLRLWRGPTSTTPRPSLNRCVEHYCLVPRLEPGNEASGAPSSMLESCTLAGSYDFSRLVREQQLLVHAGSSFIVHKHNHTNEKSKPWMPDLENQEW